MVGIVPVSRQLDLKALAAAAGGKKATMADPAAAERATGYVVGGHLPARPEAQAAHRASTSRRSRTTPSTSPVVAGASTSAWRPEDLVRLTGATTAAVAR